MVLTREEVKAVNRDQIRWVYVSWALCVGILVASLFTLALFLAIGGLLSWICGIAAISAALLAYKMTADKMSKAFNDLADRAGL